MYIIETGKSSLKVLFSGSVDHDQLFNALRDIFMHPDYPYRNSVWLFEGCECDFSNICMFDLVQMIKTYYPRKATRKKTAIVTSTSMHYAMAQLLCEEAELAMLPYSLRAFMNQDEAEGWLIEP